MRWGYNTNGCGNHKLPDALAILADLGYESIAITIDHGSLDPFAPQHRQELSRIRRLLVRLGLRSVIETGSRFLLDPRRKHQPTLVSADPAERQWRVEFLKRALDAAAELQSDAVSFWSGAIDDTQPAGPQAWIEHLRSALEELLPYAEHRGVPLALEPEPGMAVAVTQDARKWLDVFPSPWLGLTLDIGHVVCSHEDVAQVWRIAEHRLLNVHVEDIRRGVHEHLMFGEGEVDFRSFFRGLRGVNYVGGVHVELSRDSHRFPEVARQSIEFLKNACLERG